MTDITREFVDDSWRFDYITNIADEETEMTISEEAKVLDEAKEIVAGPRAADYGPAEASFLTIANLWTDYLYAAVGTDGIVSAQDVAHMLILMKVARQANSHKRDNLVDIAGYAALSQRINVSAAVKFGTE